MIRKVYTLRESPVLTATQWTDKSQAVDIVQWIESRTHGQGAIYDMFAAGALGPDGEDWGALELTDGLSSVEIAPMDFVALGVTGMFFVIKPDRFRQAYQEAHPR